MRAEVLGIGWITAAGLGRGREAVPLALAAGPLVPVTRRDIFAAPDMRFGRLDEFSRLGLAGIALALQDAGLDSWQEKRPVALIAGSRYGCLGTDAAYFDTVLPQGGELASPQLFAYTLPNCFLGEAAIRFGLTGPAYVVSEPRPDGLTPVRMALETIAWGEAEIVVTGICDLNRPEVLGASGDPAGAVFLVLRRPGAGEGNAYGEVLCGREGEMSVGGAAVTTLEMLIRNLRTDQINIKGNLNADKI